MLWKIDYACSGLFLKLFIRMYVINQYYSTILSSLEMQRCIWMMPDRGRKFSLLVFVGHVFDNCIEEEKIQMWIIGYYSKFEIFLKRCTSLIVLFNHYSVSKPFLLFFESLSRVIFNRTIFSKSELISISQIFINWKCIFFSIYSLLFRCKLSRI